MISAADFDDALGWSAPRARTALPPLAEQPTSTTPAVTMTAAPLIATALRSAEVAFPAFAIRPTHDVRVRDRVPVIA